MSEDERSSATKSIRILIVANPGDSDGSSDEEDKSFQAESSSRSQGYNYQPPPLPSTNRSPQGARPIPPHAPSPLKTNLPLDKGPHSQSSYSNPTLSSPSSTSSPAVDTTPPPSTPGFSAPALDLPVDISVKQEPLIGPSCSDGHITTRAAHIFDKIKTHLTHRSSPQRTSGNSFHFNISPTASIPEPYTSPTNTRSTPSEKLPLMVTTDGDQYLTVEISGPKSAAIIRERIFTRLHVSDEDQAHYSIYRTKLGGFAIGDALTDEQLLSLCCDRGDEPLWFFVSHSSAPVHEMSHSTSSISPTTVSTIPPPVLPLQNGAYGLLRPRSRSKHGSVSSASERLPPEVGAGYEASVSDDLDIGERDSNRSTMRAAPSRSTATTYKNYPSSPDRGRRPSGPYTRPMSPLSTVRPSPPRDQGLEADKYGTMTPTPPPAPPPLSPTSATFHDSALVPPLQSRHARSGSDAAAEREHALQVSEDQIEQAGRQWQQYRQKDDSRGKLDRIRDRYGSPVKTRGQRSKRSADVDEGSDKLGQSDSWVVVGNETPRAASKSGSSTNQDGQRTSPSILKDRTRGPYLPYSQTGSSYGGRLPMPKAGRNPPPPPTVGAGESRPSSSRTTAHAPLPPNWAVTWKVPDKTDQKAPPASTPQWNRLTAKSMTDLRNTSHNGVPINLQPGSRQGSNLPITGPERREVILIPTTTYADGPSSGRDLTGSSVPGLPKSYEPHRPPVRPLPKQGSSSQNPPMNPSQSPPKSYGTWVPPLQPPPSNYSTLISPGGDAMPRPQSAMGNAPQRYQNRNYSNDQDDIDTLSPHSSSPHRQGGMTGRLGIGRDDGPSSSQSNNWHGLRLNSSSGSYLSMQSSEAHGGLEAPRTPPRTPVSPRSPRHSANSSMAEPFNRPFTALPDTSLPNDVEESINSNETVRQEDHAWIRQMLDGDSAGSATLIPKSMDIGQSPMPTQPGPPTQPLPPLPSQLQTDSFPAPPYNPSQSTPIAEDDSESDDDDDDLWQTKPTPRSPRIKSISREKALTRGPQLTVQTEKISNLPSSSFQNASSFKVPEYTPVSNRSAADGHLSLRKLASLTPDSGKNRQRGSTFTDNECTWAPRPAPEEVYERLEEFFPEHDLDKPVIEASSGSGSPTTTDNPAVPPLADKDRSEKALVKAKKSIRIVAEEHKKRIDRTSRAENFASVLRKRSTKLWGSRLEEVTTEQAKAEHARALYAKSTPESPSGGPRPIFKWVRGELIGKGTYGRVYLALNATTGEMIAVKQVEIPQTASDKNDTRQAVYVKALKSESETLKDLDHPNVVQYLGFEETPNFLSIFLEYVPGGSIGSCLLKHGKFDEEVTKSFTEQILTGLEYLHSQGILHRDLKADNILVETTGICKISDFGISKRTDDINGIGASTAMQGTVFWMAPEVIDTPKKGYDKKIDIWSVGCVVLEMWAGKRPWSGNEAIAVILKLHKSKLPPPVPDDIILSSLAQNFYNQCFAINPEERPTAAALRKHPYLTLPPDWVFNSFKSEH